jgi:hypothetical protein
VRIESDPEFPLADVPVVIEISPEIPRAPELAVLRTMGPEDVEEEYPDRRET